jgi:uncharacterized protein
MALVLLGAFYAAMVGAGYLVELIFGAVGLVPTQRSATVMTERISWNYTTWLNIVFLVLAAVLVIQFVRTGGIEMLRMMGGAPDHAHHHDEHSGPGAHSGLTHPPDVTGTMGLGEWTNSPDNAARNGLARRPSQ